MALWAAEDESCSMSDSAPVSTVLSSAAADRRRRLWLLRNRRWERFEDNAEIEPEANEVIPPAVPVKELKTIVESLAPPPPPVVPPPVRAPRPRKAATDETRDRLRLLIRRLSGLAWVFTGTGLQGGAAESESPPLPRLRDDALDAASYEEMLQTLQEELQERALRFDPDIVLICTGSNEARAGMKGLLVFEHQLALMIEAVLDAGALPLLCTPPARRGGASVDELVYVEAIRAAAAEYDVPLVDFWDYWRKTSESLGEFADWDGSQGTKRRNGHVELVHNVVGELELASEKR